MKVSFRLISLSFSKWILFLFMFLHLEGISQQEITGGFLEDPHPGTLELLKYDAASVFGGIKEAYTQPLRWQKEDLVIAGSVVLGTAALYVFDEETSGFFRDQEERVPGILKEVGFQGSPEHFFVFDGAVYLLGLATKNKKIRRTGVLLLSSATATGLIALAGKRVLGRARPNTGEGKGSFQFLSSEDAYHSLPSGHALFSFTTAYAIGKQFRNPYVKAGIYGLGLIAPVSRLWAGEHWGTDIALSLALGVAVVESIDRYLLKERDYSGNPKEGISWDFQIGLGRVGLTGKF